MRHGAKSSQKQFRNKSLFDEYFVFKLMVVGPPNTLCAFVRVNASVYFVRNGMSVARSVVYELRFVIFIFLSFYSRSAVLRLHLLLLLAI